MEIIDIIKAIEDAVAILWTARTACFPNNMAGHNFICKAQDHLADELTGMLREVAA